MLEVLHPRARKYLIYKLEAVNRTEGSVSGLTHYFTESKDLLSSIGEKAQRAFINGFFVAYYGKRPPLYDLYITKLCEASDLVSRLSTDGKVNLFKRFGYICSKPYMYYQLTRENYVDILRDILPTLEIMSEKAQALFIYTLGGLIADYMHEAATIIYTPIFKKVNTETPIFSLSYFGEPVVHIRKEDIIYVNSILNEMNFGYVFHGDSDRGEFMLSKRELRYLIEKEGNIREKVNRLFIYYRMKEKGIKISPPSLTEQWLEKAMRLTISYIQSKIDNNKIKPDQFIDEVNDIFYPYTLREENKRDSESK